MVSRNTKLAAFVLFASSILTALSSGYMIFLKVPAVLEVRPALADVGFWTGVFSGRAGEYLYYHHPEAMIISEFVLITVALGIGALTAGE